MLGDNGQENEGKEGPLPLPEPLGSCVLLYVYS